MNGTSAASDKLWQAYREGGRREDRNRLLLSYLPLVKHVTSRLAACLPASVPVEDLHGWGIFGLMDALERYDAGRGVRFETYAVSRIRGAVLDGLRSLDWAPRSVRRRAREIEQAYRRVEARVGRPAEEEEVAAELEITVRQLHLWLQEVEGTVVLSLQDVLGSAQEPGEEGLLAGDLVADPAIPDPADRLAAAELAREVAHAIDALPERERLVITLLYYEELRPKEVAAVMGVSPSRISQLHAQALLRLKRALAPLAAEDDEP